MIFKSIIKGLFVACVIVAIALWAAWIFAAIYRGFCTAQVFNSMLMGTLCLLLWMMVRRNEYLIEEKNHWKQQYNELVGRIFKGEFFKDDKPIFNVGDWVISKTDNYFDLITNYKDGYYRCESSGFLKSYEDSYRLWQLSDAKPGNVLYAKYTGEILLFKGFDNDKIKVFCAFSDDKRNPLYVYDEKEYYGKAKYDRSLRPANEIQRKLLFDEMRNLGYELMPDGNGKLNLVKLNNKE
jgi:hypothetical protein